MPNYRLHVVSFDVPFPPSYGGVIDVFYKLKALHEAGVHITLHCFQYGRERATELEKYCAEVNYYSRKTSLFQLLSSEPFIVNSRRSDSLLKALAASDDPILFEGLHCCAYVAHPLLAKKKKIVRTHNIEHDYYRALERVEKKWSRRLYFGREARKLEKFEHLLEHAQHVLAISPADAHDLSTRYKNVEHVMAFHANDSVKCKEGVGEFAFYHGNLEVGENNQAALFLVNEVFRSLNYSLIIAGNSPSSELRAAASSAKNVSIKSNISTVEIYRLIETAHINVLPTFQATGIKLKLLEALFKGRHCLVNAPMVANTGLGKLCVIREDASSMRSEIQNLANISFSSAQIEQRKEVLGERFSNKMNAEKVLRLL